MRFCKAGVLAALIVAVMPLAAAAQIYIKSPKIIYSAPVVRFGKNVRVGGHDFSNRTFTRKRNAVIYLHKGKPRNAGCRWVAQRDRYGRPTGGKTQVCHLQSVPRNRR